MKKMFLVALAVSACVCGLAQDSSAQQGARTRRGGLDNFSLPSASAGPSVPEGWQVFEPEGAGFSVAAPAGLAAAPFEGRVRAEHRAEMRKYKVSAGGADYGVGRSGVIATMAPEDYYSSLRTVLITKSGAYAQSGKPGAKMELTRERVVVLDGYEGREFEMDGGGRRSLFRVYLIEGAVYTLGVEGLAASFPAEKAQLFFESFRLTARQ